MGWGGLGVGCGCYVDELVVYYVECEFCVVG